MGGARRHGGWFGLVRHLRPELPFRQPRDLTEPHSSGSVNTVKHALLKDILDLKHAVLQSVAAHDGQWCWYQLDRELISSNPHLSTQLMTAIRQLEAEGLIRIAENRDHSALPLYWVTDAGTAKIAIRPV